MALTAKTIFEVQTGGSDTVNGGAFDPSQTAGMFTDGAATSATGASPVFSSASYNFVAGDVGAWVYIASGTNWTAGWYQIASVGGNAATLSAAAGDGVLIGNTGPTTLAGCATTASPTGATWTIDYSQQAAAQFAYTDLASVGAGLLVSSVALPFAKQQVGNSLVITGGTNFTAGRYVIASVAVGVATVIGPGNITTGAGVSGTGGQGGALASPGQAGASMAVSDLTCFCKSGTYTILSATQNIATGCLSGASFRFLVVGYATSRTYINTGTKPIWKLNAALASATIYQGLTTGVLVNVELDGNAQTASVGIVSGGLVWRCTLKNFTGDNGVAVYVACIATGNSLISFCGTAVACEAYANTGTPFSQSLAGGSFVRCLAYNNTGASTDGFASVVNQCSFINCIAYGNGRSGFLVNARDSHFSNCHAEANAAWGYDLSGQAGKHLLNYCSAYNNTSGVVTPHAAAHVLNIGFVTITDGSVFTNAAGTDFSLNNTTLRGALLRAVGYPGVFPAGLTTGYLDIGAAQHADPAAAGGLIRHPGMSGGLNA